MKRTIAVAGAIALAAGFGASTSAASAAAPRDPSTASVDPVTSARTLLANHRDLVRGSSQDAFTVVDSLAGERGMTHVRFNRTYRGLPVLGGDFVVHQQAGARATVSSPLAAPVSVSVTPKITAAAAAATARRTGLTGKARTTRAGKPQLVVDARHGAVSLAWVTVTGGLQADGQTPSHRRTVVDARTGKVRSTEEMILAFRSTSEAVKTSSGVATKKRPAVAGTGQGIFVGKVGISTTGSGSSFKMVDPDHGGNSACDAKNRTSACTTFTDADNAWGNGTMADRASVGVDAYYGAAQTWDYYKKTFGRSGIFDDGKGVPSKVHWDTNYANARWDDVAHEMIYGDGARNNAPLTELDVAGHEMTHGVTQATADLVYANDSGGLNEATSDIFGTMVEFAAANPADPADYLIGEEVNIRGDGTPLRYMDEPSKDGVSFDCYSSDVTPSNPHYSSGVGNHFFFLLAEGSGRSEFGDSPTCDGSTITGIGRAKAAAIWYKALSAYWTANETYPQARADMIKAADELYGAGSAESKAVAAVWTAVDVS
jgi:zinc metalloprotease ZmpA